MFIQRFWCLTSKVLVTEGGNELVESNTYRGVIGCFIREFNRSNIVERYLAIVIGMSCSFMNSDDCKPYPTSVCEKSLPIRIPLAKPFEGVPVLVTFACRNVDI